MAPCLNSPKWPPFLPDGQVECFFASFSKSPPFFSCSKSSSACASSLTRICIAAAVFAMIETFSRDVFQRRNVTSAMLHRESGLHSRHKKLRRKDCQSHLCFLLQSPSLSIK